MLYIALPISWLAEVPKRLNKGSLLGNDIGNVV
jgi:hypothetical protein